jgi:hypothetical protein
MLAFTLALVWESQDALQQSYEAQTIQQQTDYLKRIPPALRGHGPYPTEALKSFVATEGQEYYEFQRHRGETADAHVTKSYVISLDPDRMR